MPKPNDGPKGQETSTEVPRPAQKRNSFSPAEKLRIVREAKYPPSFYLRSVAGVCQSLRTDL